MLYTVAAFYRFVPVQVLPPLRQELLVEFARLNIWGTLLVGHGVINGTIDGAASDIDDVLKLLEKKFGLQREDVKFSTAPENPFNRLKIRLKREIITFKQ